MKKLRIIVGGFIGLYPTGGVTWDYIQYVIGLKALGHDVYYIEDTLQYPRFQSAGKRWDDASDSISYLAQTMLHFGLQNRWAYRDIASGNCFGLTEVKLKDICKTADVFVNISASTFLRDEYMRIPKRVLIDSDPMFTQIAYDELNKAGELVDRYKMKFIVDNHNYRFTFGENIGDASCRVPTLGFDWIPTRQPICIDFWQAEKPLPTTAGFSTVMNWSVQTPLRYMGEDWGQKSVEFEKIIQLPNSFQNETFSLMVTGIPETKAKQIKNEGWLVLDPLKSICTTSDYRNFINSSEGEFSIAKETYVKANTGWFSCRSACYLASGKPVVTQETGWSKYIPAGEGLFAFREKDEASEAIRKIKANKKLHSAAARAIAYEFFDSNKVLTKLLNHLT